MIANDVMLVPERWEHVRDAVLLGCLLGLLFALPLRGSPITHHGEAREGLVVQDVVAHRHWILPRRNGELPSKPPLFHWTAAATTKLFGASDATLRLPSAIAAFVTLVAVLALGRTIDGAVTGWLACGMLLGSAPFVTAATEARVDMVFTAAITLALAGFRIWDLTRRPAARIVVYAAVAAAVLAKGPAGAVLPTLAIVAFLASDGRLRTLRDLFDWRLALAVIAVDAGWYALAIADGGAAFVRLQLVRENFERAFGGPTYGKTGRHGVARLAWSFFTGFLPWSLVLPASLVARARGTRGDAHARFLHVWWITVLALFALAAGKRAVYVLPAAPAVALLAARALGRALGADDGATSWLALLRAPRWLRVRTPAPRLAMLAVLLVLLDVGTMLGVHVTRARRAARGSLTAFAATVAATVPADAPLFAARDLGRDETLVVAYRTGRALPREPATAPPAGTWIVVPAASAPSRAAAGGRVVVVSHRARGADVALLETGGQ